MCQLMLVGSYLLLMALSGVDDNRKSQITI